MNCKYCDELFTGNCCDDILTGELKMGSAKVGDVSVFITEDASRGSSAVMELYSEVGDTPIIRKRIAIKYCPFCGKELITPKTKSERFLKFWD